MSVTSKVDRLKRAIAATAADRQANQAVADRDFLNHVVNHAMRNIAQRRVRELCPALTDAQALQAVDVVLQTFGMIPPDISTAPSEACPGAQAEANRG